GFFLDIKYVGVLCEPRGHGVLNPADPVSRYIEGPKLSEVVVVTLADSIKEAHESVIRDSSDLLHTTHE
ncbi:MAG: hypothetical protein V3R62_02065, partial [Acidiferrobacterales bacterium]